MLRRRLKSIPERLARLDDGTHRLDCLAFLRCQVAAAARDKLLDRLYERVDVGVDVFALIWSLSVLREAEAFRQDLKHVELLVKAIGQRWLNRLRRDDLNQVKEDGEHV